MTSLRRTVLFATLLFATLQGWSTSSLADQPVQPSPTSPGTVVLSGHEDYAPFMWRNDNKISGMAITAMQEVFRRLGLKTESRYVGPWKRVLKELEEGNIDVLVAAYLTDDRKEYADFTSVPISADPTSVFVYKGREFPFSRWDDLIGKRFVEIYGESQGQEFDRWRLANAQVRYVTRRIESFKLLESDRADALVTSYYTGTNAVARLGYKGLIVPLPTPVTMVYLYAAISKKSPYASLLPQINQQLKAMHDDGTLARMIEDAQLDYDHNFLDNINQRANRGTQQ
ncbi:hypothetical protein C4K68_04345 [Pokkaliibacter plantistimulans]|uniref:Solute-binding protein family 3/N-terminal domain-containing protein n=1 Tax=Proteobacteria bacterium 228 TaxID=2083153 RepID=A0A2S5KVE3_9PROT|nr:transporter substrate-binding domain-containing protein [Pokkaliibacter plantistimulans]PPC78740.1 hypothetical protein C4K68_04345 [Pokkaliibacter plantistimulans]